MATNEELAPDGPEEIHEPSQADAARTALRALGLKPGTSVEEVDATYLRLARLYARERFTRAKKAAKAAATRRRSAIEDAYQLLAGMPETVLLEPWPEPVLPQPEPGSTPSPEPGRDPAQPTQPGDAAPPELTWSRPLEGEVAPVVLPTETSPLVRPRPTITGSATSATEPSRRLGRPYLFALVLVVVGMASLAAGIALDLVVATGASILCAVLAGALVIVGVLRADPDKPAPTTQPGPASIERPSTEPAPTEPPSAAPSAST